MHRSLVSLVIARRVLLQLVRDRRTFGLILVVPFVITFIFGAAIGGDVTHSPLAVVNEDEGVSTPLGILSISDQIINELEEDERTDVIVYTSWENAKADVDSGDLEGVLFFPTLFSATMANASSTEQAKMILYVDPTEPQIRATIQTTIFDAIRQLGESSKLGIDVEWAHGFEEEPSGFAIAIPAVIPFILNFLVLLITTLTLTRETTYRTKERLFIAPIHPANIVLGYAIALSVFAMAMSGIVMLVGTVFFGATVAGNWFLLTVGIMLFGLAFVFLGVFLSTQARNELQAVQMAPLISLPSMALAGFLAPIETLPEVIQPLAEVIPLTYGIRITRGIMLKGYGLAELWFEFFVVTVLCLLFLALAMLAVREGE